MVFKNTLIKVLESVRKLLKIPLMIIAYIKGWLHFRRLAKKFPGPPSLPIVGSLFDIGLPLTTTRITSYVIDQMIKYSVCKVGHAAIQTFCLSDPSDVKRYLQNPANQNKPYQYECIGDIIGNGLVTENGMNWKRHHKILLPAFHTDMLQNQMSICNRRSDVFVEVLSEHANGVPFDMSPVTEYAVLDIACESLCDVPTDLLRNPDYELFDAMNKVQVMLSYRLGRPWLFPNFMFYTFSSYGNEVKRCKKIYRTFFGKMLSDREKLLEEEKDAEQNCNGAKGTKKRYGTVDTMIHHMRTGELTRTEVVDEIATLLAAGFDTVYGSVLMSLYSLAHNYSVQEKLFSEINDVFRENGTTELTLEVLQRMNYLDMVAKECLRMHPSVWLLLRNTGVDTPLVSSDLVVPAGGCVVISPKSMHMNSKHFSDPETFNPERFSKENSVDRDPYAFLPFSLGPRACIGRRYAWMKLKTILCKVIWNFKVLPDPTYTPSLLWAVSSIPSNGMWLKLIKRNSIQ